MHQYVGAEADVYAHICDKYGETPVLLPNRDQNGAGSVASVAGGSRVFARKASAPGPRILQATVGAATHAGYPGWPFLDEPWTENASDSSSCSPIRYARRSEDETLLHTFEPPSKTEQLSRIVRDATYGVNPVGNFYGNYGPVTQAGAASTLAWPCGLNNPGCNSFSTSASAAQALDGHPCNFRGGGSDLSTHVSASVPVIPKAVSVVSTNDPALDKLLYGDLASEAAAPPVDEAPPCDGEARPAAEGAPTTSVMQPADEIPSVEPVVPKMPPPPPGPPPGPPFIPLPGFNVREEPSWGSAWGDTCATEQSSTPSVPVLGTGLIVPTPLPQSNAGEIGPAIVSAAKVDDAKGVSDAGACRLDLDAFLGDWHDSMGHLVNVEWARTGSRFGQLDVELKKPHANREAIRLNIKDLGNGRFMCGHYDLDTEISQRRRIVWVDLRAGQHARKTSVWERT